MTSQQVATLTLLALAYLMLRGIPAIQDLVAAYLR